ncbi:hypothetical protein KW882_01430 [Vibrio parahaemolyticus]
MKELIEVTSLIKHPIFSDEILSPALRIISDKLASETTNVGAILEETLENFFETNASKITFNLSGHDLGRDDNKRLSESGNKVFYISIFTSHLKEILTPLVEKMASAKAEEDISFKDHSFIHSLATIMVKGLVPNMNGKAIKLTSDDRKSNCDCCGSVMSYILNLDTLEVTLLTGDKTDEECPYPNGRPNHQVELKVPSGKIVFANSFLELLEKAHGKDNVNRFEYIYQKSNGRTFQQNCTYGTNLSMDYFAEKWSVIDMPCGNASGYAFETDDGFDVFFSRKAITGVEPSFRVDGAVWQVSAMDYDQFCDLVKKAGISHTKAMKMIGCGEEPSIIEVDSGTYVFTHYYGSYEKQDDDKICEIKKV